MAKIIWKMRKMEKTGSIYCNAFFFIAVMSLKVGLTSHNIEKKGLDRASPNTPTRSRDFFYPLLYLFKTEQTEFIIRPRSGFWTADVSKWAWSQTLRGPATLGLCPCTRSGICMEINGYKQETKNLSQQPALKVFEFRFWVLRVCIEILSWDRLLGLYDNKE